MFLVIKANAKLGNDDDDKGGGAIYDISKKFINNKLVAMQGNASRQCVLLKAVKESKTPDYNKNIKIAL